MMIAKYLDTSTDCRVIHFYYVVRTHLIFYSTATLFAITFIGVLRPGKGLQ